jgi:hypothetical protein
MKKYKIENNHIVALRDIKRWNIKAGDIGGIISSENNLSQDGNAWVYGDAQVYGNARVYGDARVSGNAQVSGNARVYGDAQVYGNARVYGIVINLIGVCPYDVTAYADHVQIGCKLHTVKEWKTIFSKGIYKDLCESTIAYTQCKAAFDFCVSLKQRKEIAKMNPKKGEK